MEKETNEQLELTDMTVLLQNGEQVCEEQPSNNEEDVEAESVKVNGDTKRNQSDEGDSSDFDTLVIDERPPNTRKRKLSCISPKSGFRGFKRPKTENMYEPPTNPYFNESLFELSELHHNKNTHSIEKKSKPEENNEKTCANEINQTEKNEINKTAALTQSKKVQIKKKKQGSPKLCEYAQYLGLQPTVQFKCSKCGISGFSTLATLNEHHILCRGEVPNVPTTSTQTSNAPSTNFRVTRKVFLCSACGTYYENWNLFLHMREVHKRFICLYCLGMFSQSEKLSLHLVSRHNCVPSHLNSEEDFFHVYKDPCFLMCCDCEKIFSERDNFFGHNCPGKPNKSTVDINKTKNVTNSNKQITNQKIANNKLSKQTKTKHFVEHVTGDMPSKASKSESETEISQEQTSTETEKNEINCTTINEDLPLEELQDNTEEVPERTENTSEIQSQEDDVSNNSSTTIDTARDIIDVRTEPFKIDSLENDADSSVEDLQAKELNSDDNLEDEVNKSPKADSDTASVMSTTNIEEPPIDDVKENIVDNVESSISSITDQEDTRKVPKVTLKLPKSIATTYVADNEESDDSEKLTMEIDSVVGETDQHVNNEEKEYKEPYNLQEPAMHIAGSDIPIIELQLEHPLDKFDIQVLLQKCLKETIATCIYCNHARKIAVNGKYLGLHAIAEHRFSAVVNSITAEELIPESFVMRIKEGLSELENVYFNLESTSPEEGLTFSHVFECFQCRYVTLVHKELYLHNRKMHAKTILLCIMCKSNFYSYSELICHLCPGIYVLNSDISFRCCMCVNDDLPSAFRLMVHLRKRHHACDVCLELCHNQSRLSNHVWKHKLHHLCYRCGIAYRNKPDITKHLFWKHGTESVLCKKCLQKKWPHVYHFCIPPSTFTCEECNLNFTKAVSLKVHKRLHGDEKPHTCTFENCAEKFISKKLLLKHEFKHREPPEESIKRNADNNKKEQAELQSTLPDAKNDENINDAAIKDDTSNDGADKPKIKPKVDVYDLPELNLSESDSSDSEQETVKSTTLKSNIESVANGTQIIPEVSSKIKSDDITTGTNTVNSSDAVQADQPVPILENIWDDFKNYQANKEKIENTSTAMELDTEPQESSMTSLPTPSQSTQLTPFVIDAIRMDHDYSLLSQEYRNETKPDVIERSKSMDHDYCSPNTTTESTTHDQDQTQQAPKKESQSLNSKTKKNAKGSSSSDSSGDSDSSSCTCGSNCSCSGSSDSSSSSSDSSDSESSSSEGRRKQQARRDKKKQKTKNKNKISESSQVDVIATDNLPVAQVEQVIQESDLDTTETETDEDFYDKQPQKMASKFLAEKRKELLMLAGMDAVANGSIFESSRPSTPSLPEAEVKPKKKSKNKKKKKKSKRQQEKLSIPPSSTPSTSYQYQYTPSVVSPITISLPKNSPLATSVSTNVVSPILNNSTLLTDERIMHTSMDSMYAGDSSLRASKRRRIPNKFYGYSSDEDQDKQPPVLKWRKSDLPSPARPVSNSPLVVPPITIKAISAITAVEEPPLPRPSINLNELRIQPTGGLQQVYQRPQPHIAPRIQDIDSGTDSNDSSSEEEEEEEERPQPPPQFINKPNQPPLYCYCRCPYDEVSEMIGCDSNDCAIEWFHFECVGIMVPPKGQWFCPDCRKKKQQRKELQA